MSSKLWVAGGLIRLAIRPATKNRLLSTSTTSQKWLRPSDELKYYTDPEWRSRKIEQGTITTARRRQDPELREKERARDRVYHEKRKQSKSFLLWRRLFQWCFYHDWVRDQLPWKTYRPRLNPEKVEHHCMACRFQRKHGYKLWWRKVNDTPDHAPGGTSFEGLSNTEQYLCSSCYKKTGDIMPQGFEDVTSIKDLRVRAKELGIDVDKKRGQVAQSSDQALQKSRLTDEPQA